MIEPKFNIGDEVSITYPSPNPWSPDYGYIKGITYYGKEYGDAPFNEQDELYEYVVAYKTRDGEWEWEEYSEEYLK